MTCINVENISFSYTKITKYKQGNTFSIKDISISVNQGEFISFAGPNGSGKSTILKLINRIILPSSGKIEIFGNNYKNISRKELSKIISYVPQNYSIPFSFTAFEIILMGRTPYLNQIGFETKKDREIAFEAMEILDILHLANKPIDNLSGGEAQRVLIARALAQQCPILIMDEPNSHLDILHQLQILNLVKQYTIEKKLCVISIFHDLNLAAMFSDRIYLVENGRIMIHGKPEMIINENNIKNIFGTDVTVDKHPFLNKPRITMIPNFNLILNKVKK